MQPGDTLAWVAQSMGVSQYDLIAANGIANPDFIYVGQVLSNPSCGAAGYGLGAAPAQPAYADGYAAAGYGSDAGYSAPAYEAAGYDAQAAGLSDAAGYDAQAVDYPDGCRPAWGQRAQRAQTTLSGAQDTGDAMYANYPAADYSASGYGDTAYTAADTPAAMPAGETYTVQAGDNLSQIAASYGVAVGQMLQANGIQNPNIIFVGQVLVIP